MRESREIPRGWELPNLQDVVDVLDNLRKPINSDEREKRISGKGESELYPYYGATGQVGWIDEFITDGEYVLVGEDGAPFLDFYKPKAYIIKGKTWVNNHAHILRFKEGVTTNAFILHFLNQFNYNGYVNGTTRLKLTKSSLVEIPFPLPPLSEQHRIVAKIEELFSSLDKGIESLKTAQQQLKVYRQAVLKWAFEGKLTNKSVAKGELPDGWKIVKFVDFCKLQRGYDLPFKNISEGNYPVVTSSGVHGYHDEYKANGPCLITGRSGGVGNIHYLDVAKYWPHNTVLFVKDFCNNDPKYVYYYFLQFNFRGFSASTTIPTLDRKQLYNEPVCLPSLPEQRAIVAEIESRLSVCDKIEESIGHSLKQAEALRQSILKKAFEGKLVPQDPNDEPASVLLEQIKTEREKDRLQNERTTMRKRDAFPLSPRGRGRG